jgi:hypothetical protein
VAKLRRYLGPRKVLAQDNIHCKVYCSRYGAVVGSANFSTNGLEIMGERAGNLEAGVYIAQSEKSFTAIRAWCHDMAEEATRIEPETLRMLQALWLKRKKFGRAKKGKKSKSSKNRKPLTLRQFLSNPIAQNG